MNERNSEANTKSVDSLLNYETVKYFANEEHEAQRYDRALQAYERAAVKSETTLALLNVGQGGIIASGLIGIMLLAGQGVAAGAMTVGDFVLVNAYLIQLYMPLNFLGMVYRNIKQSLTDIEQMMGLLKIRPEIEDRPGAPALAVKRGMVAFRNVDFRYDPRREILPRFTAKRSEEHTSELQSHVNLVCRLLLEKKKKKKKHHGSVSKPETRESRGLR